ncbi:MAG TPA: NAD(P)-dependent oxidoreductase [Candidatus Acidoferrales bacterium]|nr:NAD(P)-dependent oxidoreductase [Candidatus Acidoferrales bacterium]
MDIGFIGLGSMGLPIASNLLTAGHKLRVYNRTASKAEPLIKSGAELMPNAAAVASPGGIVITMLADDASLESITATDHSIAHRLAPGGIHISMSTISPATARKLAKYHADKGSIYVAAPVFGRPEAAAAKRLWICTAGPESAKHKIAPILDAIGQKTFDFGEEPGAANALKVAGNFLIAAAMESMAEALAMLEKSGVDRVAAIEMITSTLFACPVYQGYGNAIAHMRHTPVGFRLLLGLKDVELALKTGGEVRAPMPIAAILRDRLISSIAKGRGEMDWSALALGARDDAGLPERK